jgi:hypothetical protein
VSGEWYPPQPYWAVYEGHSDQRIYHTFSRDSQGTAWGPEHTIPAIEKGTPQWSPVLHVDEAGGKIVLFYSESALCIRPPPGKGRSRMSASDVCHTVTLERFRMSVKLYLSNGADELDCMRMERSDSLSIRSVTIKRPLRSS